MDEEIVPEEEEDDEFEEIEFAYGIPLPSLPEGLQPLECVVLIQGIQMDTGQPTITALGSEGMAPWTAVGMLEMEAHRLKQSYTFSGLDSYMDFDEEEDE